jgi:hypothetical protein
MPLKLNGKSEYPGGSEDWKVVAEIAKNCVYFCPDVEEEQVADELRSCYNCKYRRWTRRSFTCLRE